MTLLARLAADQRFRYVFAGGLGAVVYYGLFAAGWLTLPRWIPYLAQGSRRPRRSYGRGNREKPARWPPMLSMQ